MMNAKKQQKGGQEPQKQAVETNMAAGYYQQYAVNYTVNSAGIKTIVACPQNPSLVGTVMQ